MKHNLIKPLYHLFAFLSDCTNGFKPFVKYKLVLGALLVGISASSCKGKVNAENINSKAEQDTETSTCYNQTTSSAEMEKDTVIVKKETSPKPKPKAGKKPADVVDTVPKLAGALDTFTFEDKKADWAMCYDVGIIPKDYRDYIMRNLRKKKIKDQPRGEIVVSFYIKKNKRIKDVQVLHSDIPKLNNKVIRIVKSIPRDYIPYNKIGVYDTVVLYIPRTNE